MIARTWLDRAIGFVSPRWQLHRLRTRVAAEVLMRHYEGAAHGRRTMGWNRSGADVNQAVGPFAKTLRDVARDLVRNNPYAESALNTIVDHTVGWGIVAKPMRPHARAEALWKAWAESTACDADGRHDLYGLQKLVMRTVVESGECLVRRRLRDPQDGFPIPMQLQVLEPDFLDTTKDTTLLGSAGQIRGRIIQGVEFDAIGRRAAYWLFPEHPGSAQGGILQSVRVPAENVLHLFKGMRPGQVRGPSWFAPVLLRFKDFDEYEDATLMKQKIAACLAVITTDVDGTKPPLGTADDAAAPPIDLIEPGAILNLPVGRTVEVVTPPTVREHGEYCQVTLRAIATGLGVTYEDLTGDYTELPFSAARMSRLRYWARVEDWRWRLLIPQFCAPVWMWAMEAAALVGLANAPAGATWTAPPAPMIDPVNEGLAYLRNVRTGIMSLSEALRERGYDPTVVLEEMQSDFALLDKLGLVLDSDPRKMTQAGQLQNAASPATSSSQSGEGEGEGEGGERRLRVAPLRLTGGARS